MKKHYLKFILYTSMVLIGAGAVGCGAAGDSEGQGAGAQVADTAEEAAAGQDAAGAAQAAPEETTTEEGTAGAQATEQQSAEAQDAGAQVQTKSIDLEVASNQVILVEAAGSTATLTFYQRDDEDQDFTAVLSTDASIGANGIGKTKEGDRKTPSGEYGFLFAFGNKENPGTQMPYTKVDDSYYWVDDVNSIYYNQFVTTTQVAADWTSAEHIAAVSDSYDYVLALDYNSACEKGAGSAIFLHCRPTGGAGCIAIDQSVMIQILKIIQPGCRIIIE